MEVRGHNSEAVKKVFFTFSVWHISFSWAVNTHLIYVFLIILSVKEDLKAHSKDIVAIITSTIEVER